MQIQLDIVAIILPVVALIVWLIRLEGRVNMVERANIETQKDVDHMRTDNKIIFETLAAIRESLARLEGAVLSKHNNKDGN
jgi:hypothetical protein